MTLLQKTAIRNWRIMASALPSEFIENRVRNLGFRMTDQRRLILRAIQALGEHSSFDEIMAEVQQKAPDVSPTTVYRTLQIFSRYRLIHGNELSGEKVYEVVAEDSHHHLICHRCWTDIHIEEEVFKSFRKKINREFGFLILAEHNIFMGLCPDCRREHGDELGRFSAHPKFNQKVITEE
jgi:Fe2+ or Zn2+ uptake regulation protein